MTVALGCVNQGSFSLPSVQHTVLPFLLFWVNSLNLDYIILHVS